MTVQISASYHKLNKAYPNLNFPSVFHTNSCHSKQKIVQVTKAQKTDRMPQFVKGRPAIYELPTFL